MVGAVIDTHTFGGFGPVAALGDFAKPIKQKRLFSFTEEALGFESLGGVQVYSVPMPLQIDANTTTSKRTNRH
jgi:hypothetical protein